MFAPPDEMLHIAKIRREVVKITRRWRSIVDDLPSCTYLCVMFDSEQTGEADEK